MSTFSTGVFRVTVNILFNTLNFQMVSISLIKEVHLDSQRCPSHIWHLPLFPSLVAHNLDLIFMLQVFVLIAAVNICLRN